MRLSLAPFALVLGLTVAGCSGPSPEEQVKGTWKVTDLQMDAGTAKGMNAAAVEQTKKVVMGSTLEVKPDKTYAWTLGPMPIQGDWSIAGKSLTVTPKTVMGQPVAKFSETLSKMGQGQAATQIASPATFTLADDGKTLKTDQGGGVLVFTKEAPKS